MASPSNLTGACTRISRCQLLLEVRDVVNRPAPISCGKVIRKIIA